MEDKLKKDIIESPKIKTTVKKQAPKRKKVQEEQKEEKKSCRRIFNTKKKEKYKIEDKTRYVPVISIVNHSIGYESSIEHRYIYWKKFGEEHMLTIEDLQLMNDESNKFLYEPWLIVEDEEFEKAYDLTDLYDLMAEIQNIEEFCKLPMRTIENKIDSLSIEIKQNLLVRLIQEIQEGTITNYNIVRLLEEKYRIKIN